MVLPEHKHHPLGLAPSLATPWQRVRVAMAMVGETPRWQRTCARALVTTATVKEAPRCNDNENSNVRGSLPLWGKRCCAGQKRQRERRQTTPTAVRSKGATRGGGQGTRQSCNEMGVEMLGNVTTNQTKKAQQKVESGEWRRPRYQVEARREGAAAALGNVTTNHTRRVQCKAEV